MISPGCSISDAAIPATLVVVDRDPERLRASARLFEAAGYSVITGNTAAQALSLTRLYLPDLLLVDEDLPDAALPELAGQVKGDPQLAAVFLVVQSAQRIALKGEWADRADGVLVRPCGPLDLLDRIETFLRIREAQEKCRESEQRYRMLFVNTGNPFALCEVVGDDQGLPCDCRFLEVNPAYAEMAGLPASQLIGKPVLEVLPGLVDHWTEAYQKAVLSGETARFEGYLGPQGRYFLVELYAPQPGRLASLFTDLTGRKQAEDVLKLKGLTLDNLAEEIIWFDSQGRILEVNKLACEKLGYAREDLLRLSASDLAPDYLTGLNGLNGAYQEHWTRLKHTGSLQFESFQQAKDGRVYPVEILANYLDHDGREFDCSIVRDITERRNLEKALQESEELFHTLCDAAPIGIFRCDAAWNNIYCNPRWEEIVGMSSRDGAGSGWMGGVHPDDREELGRVRAEAAVRGSGYWHEHRKLTPQGKVVWVRVLVSPIKGRNGTITGYVGTVEDITEVRQARQEVLKAQKLESIGVLAGGIAHDFNNILTAILGNVALARYQLSDPEKVAKRLEDAESAATRARDLTQQLLTFARGGEPVKKVLQVSGLLKESVAFTMHGANARVLFNLAEDLWPLEADEGQFVQVIHNLVLNAVQAMPQGGQITIDARNRPGGESDGACVEISITDTGIGIVEQHLEKIFDPYFSTTQGSGLGLASCYSIVKKHQGSIVAESVPGQGSTFRLLLPAASKHRAVPHTLEATRPAGTLRVLVMDDEEIVRGLAKAILEQLGYQADCVEDGSQATEAYLNAQREQAPFAAVILDLTVPGGIGGKEAIRMLQNVDPGVKAIVCSGYSTDPVMANFRAYGFQAVLCKPYRPHDLGRVLQELLAG
jgi:two-component system, cell cycle sensor histidine kinase and response regulator CckA